MPSRSACRFFFVLLAAGLPCGCSNAPPAAPAAPPAAPQTPSTPPRDEATAQAIERALAGEHRSSANRAHDAFRHPLDTLLFFGIRADMTVVEAWPGANGWCTEVLAPLLADNGKLYAATMPPVSGNEYVTTSLRQFDEKLASRPDLYGKVTVTRLGSGDFNVAPPGSADLVVTFGNLHGWMELGIAEQAVAELHRALKPGGTLGLVDHRADPAKPPDPRATNGYVNEEYAVKLIESAGFELLERSEINANPRDTKDYEQGVWALPPAYRAGNRERARYEAIGESDRFTLKFRKR
jgi:predicted methyltransferase